MIFHLQLNSLRKKPSVYSLCTHFGVCHECSVGARVHLHCAVGYVATFAVIAALMSG